MTARSKAVFLILLFFSSAVVGQTDTSSKFMFIGDGFDRNWTPKSLKVMVDGQIGSNTLNTTMYSDYLIRESFTPRAKSRFLETESSRINVALTGSFDAEYKISSRVGVYASSTRQVYLTGSNALSKMILFGNAQYAGIPITSSNTRFLNTSNHSVGISHLLYTGDKLKAKARYGLNIVTGYDEIYNKSLTAYTQEKGEFIDLDISNLTYLQSKSGLQGIGLDLDVKIDYELNSNNRVSFELNNFQPTMLFNKKTVSIDTAFRYEGLDFKPIGSDSGQNFSDYLDSSFQNITRKKEVKRYAVLPSNVSLAWRKRFNTKNALLVQVSTVQFGRYGYQIKAAHNYIYGPKLKIQSTLSYGNFTSIQWNESAEYMPTEKLGLYASLIGINSMFVPNWSHSYGMAVGILKRF
jgi:hypothetical protein